MDVVHDHNYIETVKKQLGNKSADELTPEEKWRLEHIQIHEQHKGHESMHAEMILILLVTLIVAQAVLVHWKQRHYQSYQLVTLIGMWIVPIVVCIRNQSWRFIFIWLVFSCITGLIFRKSLEKPIAGTTPRLVYKWFYFLYKLSYGLGIIGYVVLMATFLGLNLLFNSKPHIWMDFGVLFLFYGLYYGVLGRDIAEICTDKMASHIGYYNAKGMPTRSLDENVCAVCGNRLLTSLNENGVLESTYKLSCGHIFHEFCIRGWCIVGKKETCPYCKEKVDLKKMFCNPLRDLLVVKSTCDLNLSVLLVNEIVSGIFNAPYPFLRNMLSIRWERPHVLYGQLLDWIRWLVAWQPCIFFLVQGINWILGLE